MVGASRPLFIHRAARTPEPADQGAQTAHIPIVAPSDGCRAFFIPGGTGATGNPGCTRYRSARQLVAPDAYRHRPDR